MQCIQYIAMYEWMYVFMHCYVWMDVSDTRRREVLFRPLLNEYLSVHLPASSTLRTAANNRTTLLKAFNAVSPRYPSLFPTLRSFVFINTTIRSLVHAADSALLPPSLIDLSGCGCNPIPCTSPSVCYIKGPTSVLRRYRSRRQRHFTHNAAPIVIQTATLEIFVVGTK